MNPGNCMHQIKSGAGSGLPWNAELPCTAFSQHSPVCSSQPMNNKQYGTHRQFSVLGLQSSVFSLESSVFSLESSVLGLQSRVSSLKSRVSSLKSKFWPPAISFRSSYSVLRPPFSVWLHKTFIPDYCVINRNVLILIP